MTEEKKSQGEMESISERKSISSIVSPERRRSETGPKILFAPEPRHRDIGTLPLTRTFTRNSYSSAMDEEEARVKKATRTKNIDPHTILPVGLTLSVYIC